MSINPSASQNLFIYLFIFENSILESGLRLVGSSEGEEWGSACQREGGRFCAYSVRLKCMLRGWPQYVLSK